MKRTKKITVTALNDAGVNSLKQRVEQSLGRYNFKLGVTQDIINEVTEDLIRWVDELLKET